MTDGPHILIADDHDLFRRGLRYALVDTMPGVVVSEASSLEPALEILATWDGIALASFDLRMPGMRDGQALADIRRLYPSLPIAVLSASEGRRIILESLEAGASGFIPKSLPADEIVAAIADMMIGRIYVPPHITALEPNGRPSSPNSAKSRAFDPITLTPRQHEVFDLMMAGLATKEMARALDIAEGTVKIYLAAIFRLLEARNRIDAVIKAIALGFIPNPR